MNRDVICSNSSESWLLGIDTHYTVILQVTYCAMGVVYFWNTYTPTYFIKVQPRCKVYIRLLFKGNLPGDILGTGPETNLQLSTYRRASEAASSHSRTNEQLSNVFHGWYSLCRVWIPTHTHPPPLPLWWLCGERKETFEINCYRDSILPTSRRDTERHWRRLRLWNIKRPTLIQTTSVSPSHCAY